MLIVAGLALIALNLLGLCFPGIDIAMSGIYSAQPLFDPGLPLRVLPLLAFLLGVVAGGGLLARIWWARGLTMAYAVILALGAPLWAQQLSLPFLVYTSKPPAVLPVVLLCLGAATLVPAAVLILNRPSIKALFPPPTPVGRRAVPWKLALATVALAGTHFAVTMYVHWCLATMPIQNGVPPPPLPPLASAAFPFTLMLPVLVSGTDTPISLFIGQSLLLGALYTFGAALLMRITGLGGIARSRPWSGLLFWPLAGVIASMIFAMLIGALFFAKLIPTREVHIASRDYATGQARLAALRKFDPAISDLGITDISDAAYELHQYISLGPDGYSYRIALKVDPAELQERARHWKRSDDTSYAQDEEGQSFLTGLGADWPVNSRPVNYRVGHGQARVYRQEGILLVTMMD